MDDQLAQLAGDKQETFDTQEAAIRRWRELAEYVNVSHGSADTRVVGVEAL